VNTYKIVDKTSKNGNWEESCCFVSTIWRLIQQHDKVRNADDPGMINTVVFGTLSVEL
jgi:hypothetical protein